MVATETRVTAEDVKAIVRAYAAQQFDGECQTAAVVFDVDGRSETLLVREVNFPTPAGRPSIPA